MNQVDFFKCLADQTRLDILMMIFKQGERCVCDLTVGLDLSQPKISRHLALLRSAQILQDRRQGQWVYYQLHDDLALWCKEILLQLSAQDQRFECAQDACAENPNCC
ncbi:ArsR/SmtB family transcription factor [Acinetobacter piscicola]|uniref:ArsR/SmtB family transcription factor n=1 Tax=Acinetobacter piscicola TaxID=2006115 RepID=UPI0010203AA6|nr:metalloregulator ArsR/SmtB family transcription factor [Acinetobacter piscicola]RYL27069.1 metalloregulator ArsR/SmtB family transcription factor [Acinetobacter piscicola]